MYGVMTDNNGLYYMRARFYSPEIKRFVNQDILLGFVADGQTPNRYAYVTGQPVSYIDLFGLEKVEVIIRGSHWFRHAEIIIGNNSYSNGRYLGTSKNPFSSAISASKAAFHHRRSRVFRGAHLDKDEDADSTGLIGSNLLKEQSAGSSRWQAKSRSWPSVGLELNLTVEQVRALRTFYDKLIENSESVPGKSRKYHKLGNHYFFLGNNCSTLVAEGLMSALPFYQDFLLHLHYIDPFFDPSTLHILLELSPGVVSKTHVYKSLRPEGVSDEQWILFMRR